MKTEKKPSEWLQAEIRRIIATYYDLMLKEVIKKGIAAKKANNTEKND